MMKFSTILKHPAEWMLGDGPFGDIVMTSRVRLARNLSSVPFPGWAEKEARQEVLQRVWPSIEGLPEMKDAFSQELQGLSKLQKQVLVERHLISREHAARGSGSAAVMNRRQSLAIMINEEDHLRVQTILPGLQLGQAYRFIDDVDSELEDELDFAFDNDLGYLTACPTNLGTGMRASAMLHLPALVLSDTVNKVITAVNKIGFAVRGLYGEGTEALANLFQVSNQTTLGESEASIIERLEKVIHRIIEHEQNARQKLLEEKPEMLRDQVARSYAILRYAHVMHSKEALNLLSMLRLGADMDFFPPNARALTDLLLMEIQPAHLQITAKQKLGADERDQIRAQILRDKLKTLAEPDMIDSTEIEQNPEDDRPEDEDPR